eukprot:CAMPEP_0183532516 /NCGR_PEP_ID=MMETSP0371-20130417/25571_1 /TAXON_ID=268820 /ORGANISM="Peridinium aciculiferum, Strain PAER-2" /LENGTH=34 /DNA_ID= /DNA_START= /DNA_END= /DNA_ORIENTATION=
MTCEARRTLLRRSSSGAGGCRQGEGPGAEGRKVA